MGCQAFSVLSLCPCRYSICHERSRRRKVAEAVAIAGVSGVVQVGKLLHQHRSSVNEVCIDLGPF